MSLFLRGETVALEIKFAVEGRPQDPTALTVTLKSPGGTVTDIPYESPPAGFRWERKGLGVYVLIFEPQEAGVWLVSVEARGSGVVSATELKFEVKERLL